MDFSEEDVRMTQAAYVITKATLGRHKLVKVQGKWTNWGDIPW